MVTGINTFKNHFRDFTNSYILIGGAACDYWFTDLGINFRVTHDLDIILIVEALDKKFVQSFWNFIKYGKYKIQQKNDSEPVFFRFMEPQIPDFPKQLELFSRKLDIWGNFDNATFTPIPTDDDLSSLSAILMNEDYYNLTIQYSEIIDNLHLAKTEALVFLKTKAFLDLSFRRKNGYNIDKRKVTKHLNDVIKLTFTLPETTRVNLPLTIKNDIKDFFEEIKEYNPDFKAIGKDLGLQKLTEDDFVKLYNTIFL